MRSNNYDTHYSVRLNDSNNLLITAVLNKITVFERLRGTKEWCGWVVGQFTDRQCGKRNLHALSILYRDEKQAVPT